MNKIFSYLALLIGVFLLTTPSSDVLAQASLPNSRIEQSRRFDIDPTLRQKDGGLEVIGPIGKGESPVTPGDDDLGVQAILHREEKYKSFAIFGNLGGYYTSNAFLTKNNPISDTFCSGEAGMSYRPKFTDSLSGDITFKQQFFRYEENQVLDFDGQNATASLYYIIPDFWDVTAFGRYGYTRLTRANSLVDGPAGTEFYKNHGVAVGLHKVFQFSKAHFMYVGWSSELGFTEWQDDNVADPERDEHSAFVGYQASITRKLDAQLFYRIACMDYSDQDGRTDLNQILSGGLVYKFTDWLSLNATSSANFNNSNKPILGDYEAYSTGGSLGVNYKF